MTIYGQMAHSIIPHMHSLHLHMRLMFQEGDLGAALHNVSVVVTAERNK